MAINKRTIKGNEVVKNYYNLGLAAKTSIFIPNKALYSHIRDEGLEAMDGRRRGETNRAK
jgi:hypothetical protein